MKDTEGIRQVLSYYDVGEILSISLLYGTAKEIFLIRTSQGEYFLCKRDKKFSSQVQLKYDHSLMHHLASRGINGPNPLPTRCGDTWVVLNGDTYDLHPFVKGGHYERKNVRMLASAARALAHFHSAAADFEELYCLEKRVPRYDAPIEVLAFLRETKSAALGPDKIPPSVIDYLIDKMEEGIQTLTDDVYYSLPQTIIHGDYHPENVRFCKDEVCGIFNIDWASKQPRIRDIVDGVLYFAARRSSDIDGKNIYSLTEPFKISVDKSRIFVTAYCEEGLLTEKEIIYMPWFMRMRWVYSRFSGMRRVPEEQRLSFFFDGILEPLLWLDSNEDFFVETMVESIRKILKCRR